MAALAEKGRRELQEAAAKGREELEREVARTRAALDTAEAAEQKVREAWLDGDSRVGKFV